VDDQALVSAFLNLWAPGQPPLQANLEAVLSVGFEYRDPLRSAVGHPAFVEVIRDTRTGLGAGDRFRLTSGVDTIGDWCRFGWSLRRSDGQQVLFGNSFAQRGRSRKLDLIVTFFGPLPALRITSA
jgi:hypothetical protein